MSEEPKPEESLAAPTTEPAAVRRRARVGKHAARSREQNTRSASKWVLAIAIMQLLFGVYFGIKTKNEVDKAMQQLSSHGDDETFDIEGKTVTVAKLRQDVQREGLQAFVVPIGLAVMFLGLWLWARKSPLPALSAALALFVTVHAIVGALDPKQLASGFLFKVLCIAALVRGIKSAMQQRAIDQRQDTASA